MQVKNQIPHSPGQHRLACIFVSPAKEDIMTNQPFNDPNAGLFIRNFLSQNRIDPASVFLGYLNQFHTPGHYAPESDTAQISKAQLRRDLEAFKPNCILIFGAACLNLAGVYHPVHNYRGSIFHCNALDSPFYSFKCVPTLKVTQVMTSNYGAMPLLKFDIKKAIRESLYPDYRNLPSRTFELTLGPDEIITRLQNLPSRISLDIEGGIPNPSASTLNHRFPQGVTCLSIATSTTSAFIIPFTTFSVLDTTRIILELRQSLANPKIEKVLQNGLYDAFVLAYLYSVFISNIEWDTMLSGFEIYPELPKSLEVQTSIYTNEPYYKVDRRSADLLTHWAYCCKDSCVTLEIADYHRSIMNVTQLCHFRENMALIPIILYMELRGMAYNRELSDTFHSKVLIQMSELQTRINTRIGSSININSPKQLNNLFYNILQFPKQHPPKIEGFGPDKTKLTSNVDAILNICQKIDAPILHEILAWRKLEKIRTALAIKTDPDGRVRCSYNPVGTETNRFTSSKSSTGNGANLQTITKKLRHIYSAGPSISKHTPGPRYFFQVDLAGADGWTVAAHCNKLGDPTMLLDYLAGIKPARVIGLMHLQGAEVSRLSREELAVQSLVVGKGEHEALYFTCKQVQHGSNYYLGHSKMAQLIVKSSYKQLGKAIRVSTSMCATLQDLYFARYKGVKNWQKQVEAEIKKHGALTNASGHVRIFFGRRNSSETFRQAYAQEPQHNTTYVTNRATTNLWNDPDNRLPDGSLIIEPHHQMHDSLNGSFPVDRLEWALLKIRSYFDFTITIAGQPICIPFEGEYGEVWGHTIGQI